MPGTLSDLDRSVVDDARAWLRDEPGVPTQILAQVSAVSHGLVRRAMRSPRIAELVRRVADGLLERFEPLSVVGPTPDPDGAEMTSPAGRAAGLRRGDGTAGDVLRSYRLSLSLQGAATGAASVNVLAAGAAMATDIVATTLGLLNASAETLAGYGHDADLKERAVACVLLAGETEQRRRHDGLLAAAGIRTAASEPREELPQVLAGQTGARVLNEAVEAIVRRRVHRRALATVPLVGAVAGAATSAVMTSQVCAASRHAGRLGLVHRHVGLDTRVLAS